MMVERELACPRGGFQPPRTRAREVPRRGVAVEGGERGADPLAIEGPRGFARLVAPLLHVGFRGSRLRCAASSSLCTARGSSTGPSASSIGIPSLRPRSRTWRFSRARWRGGCGACATPSLPRKGRTGGESGEGAFITVATTRPETFFGDTAVAVHPDDERMQGLIGRRVRLPFVGREIPVVADAAVAAETGERRAQGHPPAHDFTDFEIGERHGLARINIMDERARLLAGPVPAPFAGMEARGGPRGRCRRL